MKIRKIPFLASFVLATLFVVSQTSFAQGTSSNQNDMMNKQGMSPMLEMMSTESGHKMMDACNSFMKSFDKK
ncbi:hypothetical protein JOC86_003965 [Bacillus pakistanensis]|uniref:Uncharacterized protein n=1 Tax=Rossellomorea pakistanensis TaxID=992288 RepID=A0ABS2NHQ0_9BACI|nr:hypothetical protein [Bacillus pakistanensis]MBM7587392.1 hypothetical protein [Bacillus pakistanensis]